jgi:hypothetical protein
MRPRPHRIERLPQQYFTALLAQVSKHAALDGEPLVDLGRGNPEVGPPQHVIDALAAAANDPSAHGYPPFRGLPALREAIAARYSELYGVELMPHQPRTREPPDRHTEVTLLPGDFRCPVRKLRPAPSTGSRSSTSLVSVFKEEGRNMSDTEDEGSILEALDPGREEVGDTEDERSILVDINHIREHIETLEDAARAARAVEFDQIRAVVEQLETVAGAARAVEGDLARELADTNRMSVATARVVRDRLAAALLALAEALVTVEGPNSTSSTEPQP